MLTTNTTLYRQWFRGADIIVADSLSRDAYFLPKKTHEIFLQHSATLQMPKGFRILVTSVLLPLPVKQHRLMQQKPRKLAHSNVGYLSFLASELKKNLQGFSIFQQNIIFSAFAQAMQEATFTKEIESSWWREQSTPPSHMWHRPTGQRTGTTPDWTAIIKLALSSKNNSEGIAIRMAQEESRKLYQ